MAKNKPQVNIFQMSSLPEGFTGASTDILRCLYGLNDLEIDVFSYLLKESGKVSVKTLADAVGKNRSTVQRALSHLQEIEIVAREQDTPESPKETLKGGYCYKYALMDPKVIEINLKTRLNQWTDRATDLIEQIRSKFMGFKL
jgi:predicted transcriptional regulator